MDLEELSPFADGHQSEHRVGLPVGVRCRHGSSIDNRCQSYLFLVELEVLTGSNVEVSGKPQAVGSRAAIAT
jgi:hypothetical protein